MALFTSCILCKRQPEDGLRVSVMSRHTLSDGRTPDSRINDQSCDQHVPLLGPSPSLIGDYYKRGLPWAKFEKRYLEEIRDSSKRPLVKWLADLSMQRDVTILCIEPDASYCHRRLLAEECSRLAPELKIVHR